MFYHWLYSLISAMLVGINVLNFVPGSQGTFRLHPDPANDLKNFKISFENDKCKIEMEGVEERIDSIIVDYCVTRNHNFYCRKWLLKSEFGIFLRSDLKTQQSDEISVSAFVVFLERFITSKENTSNREYSEGVINVSVYNAGKINYYNLFDSYGNRGIVDYLESW